MTRSVFAIIAGLGLAACGGGGGGGDGGVSGTAVNCPVGFGGDTTKGSVTWTVGGTTYTAGVAQLNVYPKGAMYVIFQNCHAASDGIMGVAPYDLTIDFGTTPGSYDLSNQAIGGNELSVQVPESPSKAKNDQYTAGCDVSGACNGGSGTITVSAVDPVAVTAAGTFDATLPPFALPGMTPTGSGPQHVTGTFTILHK